MRRLHSYGIKTMIRRLFIGQGDASRINVFAMLLILPIIPGFITKAYRNGKTLRYWLPVKYWYISEISGFAITKASKTT